MGNFKITDEKTSKNEGGYAFNKADRGGRTLNGIAQNFWPKWEGWVKVMAIISRVGENARLINAEVRKDAELQAMISKFYKQNFWDVLKLDQIKDQQLAETVYDFGVNSGTGRAAKFLQQSYNTIQLFKESGLKLLVEDGKVGAATIDAINKEDAKEMHSTYNGYRETFYRSIAKGNQKQFLKSWLSRLHPYNEMKMIQYKLGVVADGIYGEKTKEAIRQFQAKNGLKVDGIPGKNTLEALYKI